MKILKNASKTIEWTKWQNKDRNQECLKVMYELSSSWVQEERKKIDENPQETWNHLSVSSAYDNVLYTPLMEKLVKDKCPNMIIVKYLDEWRAGRFVKFVIDNDTTIIMRNTNKGLAQGGVLTPIPKKAESMIII